MTRKTRSQAKAKAKASASQRRDDDIGTGICEPIGTNHTCEVAITGIVRSAENDVPQTIRMVRFITSESAAAGSVEHNCVVCNRPIDAERSLQCQTCSKFYHVECAKGSECLDQFTCESCVPRSSAPPPSSSCGRSSTSSTRRARLVRELALLEEERKLEEETRREQLDRERLMSERAAMEKIERDKQYLARKRDLLNQQDEEDEIVSIRSHHSARTTEKRIEDWIDNQAKSASDPGTGVVGETSKPCTPTHHTPVKSVGTHGQQCTSTPIRNEQTTSRDPFPIKAEPLNPIEIDLLSPTRTTGSITIGESDPGEAAGGNVATEINQISPPISLVNLNSLQNLLEEQKPTVKYTGTLPKLANNVLLPYGQWQVDTALRRKTNELEQRHQCEIATRRRRELDLVDEIKRLQLQKDSETDKFRKHEADTKKKLQEFSDRQTAMELRRHEELQQRDVEIRRLKDAERRLTDQLQVVSQKRQLDGAVEISPSSTTHMERQQSAPMNLTSPQLGNSTGTTGFRNDPPLVSSKSPYRNETNASIPRYRNDEHLPPKSSISNNVPSPHSDHYLPPLINHPAIPPATTTVGSQRLPGHSEVFCPSPEQLAARQVLSRELPTFNGDPLDWPLFFSSYINSTSACGYSEAENLLRLQRALQGPAKEAVSSFLLHPSTVPQVLSTLQILFGRPEQIVHIMIEKVRTTPPPKPERLETLISVGLVVQNLCAHLKAVGLNWHLSNPTLLQELVDKLPANVKFNWALYQQQLPVVDLDVFSEYMSRVTSAASSVTLTSAHQKTTKDDRPKLKDVGS